MVVALAVMTNAEANDKDIDNGPERADQIYLTTCNDREKMDLYNQKLCDCRDETNTTEVEEKDREKARHLVCSCDSRTFTSIRKPALRKAYDIRTIEIHQAAEGKIEPRYLNNLNDPNNQNKDPLRFVLPPNTKTITFTSCEHIKFMGNLEPKSLEDITINKAKSFTLGTKLSKDLKTLKVHGQNQRGMYGMVWYERTKFIKTAAMKGKPIIDEASSGTADLTFESVDFPDTSGGLFKNVKANSIDIKTSKFEKLNDDGTIFGDMKWETTKSLKITNTEIGSIFELGLDSGDGHGEDNTITFIGNEIKSTCNKRSDGMFEKDVCFIPEKKIIMDTYTNNTIICKCEENGNCQKDKTGITNFLHACKSKTLAETACSDAVGEPVITLELMSKKSECEGGCSNLEICLITIRTENPTTPPPTIEQEGIKQSTLILIIIFILLGAGCLFLTIIFCFPDLFKLKPESTMYKPTEADRGEEGQEIPDDEPSYKQLMVNEINPIRGQS